MCHGITQLNCAERLGKIKTNLQTPLQSKWKPKEIHLLIFNSVQCCKVVLVFSSRMRHIFFLPACLLVEPVWMKTEFSRYCRKWTLASQLHTRRFTLLKTSTSARGLERRRKGKALYCSSKSSKSKLGSFGTDSWSSGSRADEAWQLSIHGLFWG